MTLPHIEGRQCCGKWFHHHKPCDGVPYRRTLTRNPHSAPDLVYPIKKMNSCPKNSPSEWTGQTSHSPLRHQNGPAPTSGQSSELGTQDVSNFLCRLPKSKTLFIYYMVQPPKTGSSPEIQKVSTRPKRAPFAALHAMPPPPRSLSDQRPPASPTGPGSSAPWAPRSSSARRRLPNKKKRRPEAQGAHWAKGF